MSVSWKTVTLKSKHVNLLRFIMKVYLSFILRKQFLLSLVKRADVVIFWQIPQEINKENGTNLLINDQNKYKSMWIRTLSSLWMLGSFVFVLCMGHLYIWAMVVVIQIFMASELFTLLRRAHENKRLPGFRLLNW